jgi:hypothetical protein
MRDKNSLVEVTNQHYWLYASAGSVYDEEDTCMLFEEEDTCLLQRSRTSTICSTPPQDLHNI